MSDHTPADRPAVILRGLLKRFDDKTAVDHLDLDVPRGTFFGLVGPNGAGKSTTLKIATGLLRPDAGTAEVNGLDVWADPHRVQEQIEPLRMCEDCRVAVQFEAKDNPFKFGRKPRTRTTEDYLNGRETGDGNER